MKVALVHDYLLEMGGAERVLMVLAEIFPEAPIYTLVCDHKKWTQFFPRERIRASSLHQVPEFLRGHRRWLLPFLPLAAETINLRDFDVVISSSAGFAKGIITNSGTVHVSYCHTPTRFLWDLYHYYVNGSSKLNWLKKPILHWLRLWDLAASQRVDYFIANSQNTRRRVKKYYNRDSNVIYPPVDIPSASYSLNGLKINAPLGEYFLIASRLLSYKRIDLAVDAFNKTGLPLIIIGEGPERRRLEKKSGRNIKFLGWQPEEIKNLYLKHCAAFVFPGDEDFGIAPVEAMMLGRPVLAFRAGGLLESVIEGRTGEFFDEASPESLIEGLLKLKANARNYHPEFVKNHAKKFEKERFVKEIKEFIEKVTESEI